MSDTHLRWVQYNRGEAGDRPRPPVESERTRNREQWEAARRGTATRAGKLVERLIKNRSKLSVLQRRLLAVLDEQGGEGLVDQVEALGVRRGVLRIETSDGVTLYDLRLRWEQRLLQAVRRQVPEAGVHAVRFALMKQSGRTSLER